MIARSQRSRKKVHLPPPLAALAKSIVIIKIS